MRPVYRFDHERMDVYQVAVRAIALGAALTRRIPLEDRFLRSQLLRALTSVCFNLAEGTAEFSPGDKARFYRMSLRSASESAAIVDAIEIMGYAKPPAAAELRELLARVAAMLQRMIGSRKRRPRTGADPRTEAQDPTSDT